MKTTVYEIKKAKSQTELNNAVEKAAAERNCELDSGLPYLEQTDWFESEANKSGNGKAKMLELAEILRAAEVRWFELNK